MPRKLRAPQVDGAALVDPPLAQVAALVERNRAIGERFDHAAGFPTGYRAEAKKSVLVALAQVAGNDPQSISERVPLIFSGHQPELFHPGVWFKNFALSSIAKAVGGLAINLAVDSDIIRSAGIRVPTGGRAAPRVVDVPLDAAGEDIPWEERRILNPPVFRNFADQVRQAFQPWQSAATAGKELILDRLWPLVMAASDEERPANLGQCLALGRHRLERELGLETNELPLHLLVQTDPFAHFAEHLLERAAEFRAIHNAEQAEYRLRNGVRSRSHPAPELMQDGDWVEAPFWLWSRGNPRRRHVFVRRSAAKWELTDREGIVVAGAAGEPLRTIIGWDAMQRQGIKLRPRALVTTMYARLVLSDLFLHGIGGAKYDELTDAIIRRLFGVEPPAYLTATATFRLPIDRPQASPDDVRDCARRIRELRYRPESFLNDPEPAREPQIENELISLAAEKRSYLAAQALRRASPEVFTGLDRINRAMRELLRPVEEHLRREQARLVEEARRARLLGSREFSFVLFPEEYLVPRLLELSEVPA
ncbi:MAG: hypothetical protein WD872_15810 [Pirellulaceae bacterium]